MTGETWEGDGAAGIGIKSACGRFVAFVTEWTDRGKPDNVSDEDLANAEFICLACNCHHDLLAACEAFINAPALQMGPDVCKVARQARAAIAKATL